MKREANASLQFVETTGIQTAKRGFAVTVLLLDLGVKLYPIYCDLTCLAGRYDDISDHSLSGMDVLPLSPSWGCDSTVVT